LLGENSHKTIEIFDDFLSDCNPTNLQNQHKLSGNITSNKISNKLQIKQINYKEKFLHIEFNNNITIHLELYLTSEKITNNIPAKYKINLVNIF
jgi:hypothetical protein